MTKNIKTPLSYAGGKSRFLKQLDENTPNLENVNNFYDLFLGGGSFAIYITKKYPHLNIYVNDINSKLINFWQVLQNQNDDLVDKLVYIKNYYDKTSVKKLIKDLRNNKIENDFDKAVAYYLANKCSFAGTTESGGFSNYNYENKFNITTHGNEIYYYEDIYKEQILELIYQIKNLTNELQYQSLRYNFSPNINLHIYSNGGDAFMGLSIYDFILEVEKDNLKYGTEDSIGEIPEDDVKILVKNNFQNIKKANELYNQLITKLEDTKYNTSLIYYDGITDYSKEDTENRELLTKQSYEKQDSEHNEVVYYIKNPENFDLPFLDENAPFTKKLITPYDAV